MAEVDYGAICVHFNDDFDAEHYHKWNVHVNKESNQENIHNDNDVEKQLEKSEIEIYYNELSTSD